MKTTPFYLKQKFEGDARKKNCGEAYMQSMHFAGTEGTQITLFQSPDCDVDGNWSRITLLKSRGFGLWNMFSGRHDSTTRLDMHSTAKEEMKEALERAARHEEPVVHINERDFACMIIDMPDEHGTHAGPATTS